MPGHTDFDLTFLAARLHGRRSRMAEAERLDELCGLQSVLELSRRVLSGTEIESPAQLQKGLIARLAREVSELRDITRGPIHALLDWELVRFAAANLKVLLRGLLNGAESAQVMAHLVEVPGRQTWAWNTLAESADVRELVALVPQPDLKAALEQVLRSLDTQEQPFFFEAALDRAWLQEMLARAQSLGSEDAELVREMVAQEARVYHLTLALRGRGQQGLEPASLIACQVALGPAERRRFREAVADPRLLPAQAEAVGWSRFLHLANRAFRRAPMGEAAVAGYTAIRRIELANLITISEGIRSRVPAPLLRSRLIPVAEAGHA